MHSAIYTLQNLHDLIKKIPIKKSIPILLYGQMGAGKTTITKEIIKQLIDINKIEFSSPTYNIINEYKYNNITTIYHSDLSRIQSPNDTIINYIAETIENNIHIIEWPNIIKPMLNKYVQININIINNNSREIFIHVNK
ncbi:MAG: tRNA (adenosine(37)-N6)-threonylcarbamoyltransferase complex ATPase subunit type 1 TsaE [Pseudomonadota bacterium]